MSSGRPDEDTRHGETKTSRMPSGDQDGWQAPSGTLVMGTTATPLDVAHVDLGNARSIRDEGDLAGQRALQGGARRLSAGREDRRNQVGN